jgi:hypothetical protein
MNAKELFLTEEEAEQPEHVALSGSASGLYSVWGNAITSP